MADANPPRPSPPPLDDACALFLDVDGTLVDHDGAMSARVRRAVQAVVAAGHHVVIATGRSRAAALPVVELAGITRGYAVASNGGITLRIDAEAPGGYAVIDAAEFRPEPALRTLREGLEAAQAQGALTVVDGATPEQRAWRIQSANLTEAP